jgi:hypothetical protein
MVVALNIAYCAGKYAERRLTPGAMSKKRDLTPNLSNFQKPGSDPEVKTGV